MSDCTVEGHNMATKAHRGGQRWGWWRQSLDGSRCIGRRYCQVFLWGLYPRGTLLHMRSISFFISCEHLQRYSGEFQQHAMTDGWLCFELLFIKDETKILHFHNYLNLFKLWAPKTSWTTAKSFLQKVWHHLKCTQKKKKSKTMALS